MQLSTSRQHRAEQVNIIDVREIDGASFDVGDDVTVYEVDLYNEKGELRENVTIIPSILFESTKDVQHRHELGVVGKYTRALAMHNEQARSETVDAIRKKRDEVQAEMRSLRDKDAALLHAQADMNGY